MKRMAGQVVFAVLAMIFLPRVASAQAAAPVTIWDGVYTDAQAARGKSLVEANCSTCHTTTEWSSAEFMASWSGKPVDELHGWIRQAMPLNAPGKLTSEQYVDIVAYILKLNSAPTGRKELTAEHATLSRIRLTPPKSSSD